jgi:hypothetical protein
MHISSTIDSAQFELLRESLNKPQIKLPTSFFFPTFLNMRQATLPFTEPCLLYIMFNIQRTEAPENTNRISMQDRVRRTLLCVTGTMGAVNVSNKGSQVSSLSTGYLI